MATCNFMSANCTRYFVIGMNKYFSKETVEENGMDPKLVGEYDEVLTDMEFQAEKDSIVSDLEEKGWIGCDEYEDDARVIAYKTMTFNYGGCEISLKINALIRSGYYEGACMDLSGTVSVYGGWDSWWHETPEYDMFDEIDEKDVIDDDWTNNPGLNCLQAKNIINKLDSIIEDLRDEAEYVFSCNCGEELAVAYHCSNGETVYSRIEKRLYQEVDETKPTKAA